jgi:hypothetical protein
LKKTLRFYVAARSTFSEIAHLPGMGQRSLPRAGLLQTSQVGPNGVRGLKLRLGLGRLAELGVSAAAVFPQPGIFGCGTAGAKLDRFALQHQEVTALPP